MDYYNLTGEIPMMVDDRVLYSTTFPDGFILPRGKYKFFLYGSPGANYTTKDGAGAFVTAVLDLSYVAHEILMYPCVYNDDYGMGGTSYNAGCIGGGSTDVRLVMDNDTVSIYSAESRCSRIIVAAGGGGMAAQTSYQYKSSSTASTSSGSTALTYGGAYQTNGSNSAVSHSSYSDTLSYGGGGASANTGGSGGTTKAASSVTSGISIQIFNMGGGGGGGGGYFGGGGGAGASAILGKTGRLLGSVGSSGSFYGGGRGGNAAKTTSYTYAVLGTSASDYGRWCGGGAGGGGSNYVSGYTPYTCEWNGSTYEMVNTSAHSSGLQFTNVAYSSIAGRQTYPLVITCLEKAKIFSLFTTRHS